jgi:two-component system cell cycle response regulator
MTERNVKIELENIKHLPTLPGIALEVMKLSLSPDVSIPRMANLILKDVGLSTRILKTVNSPYYPLSRSVTNISDALVLLGLQTVKNITLSLTVMDSFKGRLDMQVYNLLQTRSLKTAVTAQAVAEDSRLIPSENAFLGGLLEELGILLLACLAPQEFTACLDEAEKRGLDITIIVRESLQVDYSELGLKLAEHWSLAGPIKDVIRYHRNPEEARQANIPEENFRYVIIGHLGHLAAEIYTGQQKILRIEQFKEGYRRYLNKADSDADNVLHKLADLIAKAAAAFNISTPPPRNYALILEDANAELARINLQYEQMYRELMDKVDELDLMNKQLNTLTDELSRKNAILEDLAAKDGLTGLYNHRYFQEFMRKQVLQAKRYERVVSLVLLDIDHFKNLNDTYGHQCGDQVLKELAAILRSLVRKSDIIARYGGEEFAIIMPETDIRGALIAAEKIRRKVQQHKSLTPADEAVTFTISLGVAELSESVDGATGLMGAADRRLYQAKRSGRNQVCAVG